MRCKKNFEFNIGSNDEGKGKIDFEIPEILCVVNVDVGVNGVSVNELKLAVTENANEDITKIQTEYLMCLQP